MSLRHCKIEHIWNVFRVYTTNPLILDCTWPGTSSSYTRNKICLIVSLFLCSAARMKWNNNNVKPQNYWWYVNCGAMVDQYTSCHHRQTRILTRTQRTLHMMIVLICIISSGGGRNDRTLCQKYRERFFFSHSSTFFLWLLFFVVVLLKINIIMWTFTENMWDKYINLYAAAIVNIKITYLVIILELSRISSRVIWQLMVGLIYVFFFHVI